MKIEDQTSKTTSPKPMNPDDTQNFSQKKKMTPKNYSQKKKKKDTQKLISGVLSHSPEAPHALSSPHQPPTGLAGGPLPTTSYWFKPDLSSNIYPYSVPYFFSGSLLFVW